MPVHPITNIIFDLGGVLLDIDPRRTFDRFVQMGINDIDGVMARMQEMNIYANFDTGVKSPERFRDEVREACRMELPDQQIDDAWNALLLDFPAPRVELLKQLKQHYRLYLLSNTNITHYIHYSGELKAVHGVELHELFDGLYLSFVLGLRKPDREIYDYVLTHGGFNPSETLFIDDSLENIEAARNSGIRGIHLNHGMEVTALFENGFIREGMIG
jgi:putative hydrolase of the HAD superfamily